MLKKSFKLKILAIFILPTVALIYFSSYFISAKYGELTKTSELVFSSMMIESISNLIHNVQIERGLSAGYIVTKNDRYKEILLNQRNLSDKTYMIFTKFIKLSSDKIKQRDVLYKIKPKISQFLQEMHKLKKIREAISDKSIKFNQEIEYFSKINKNLIDILKILITPSNYKGNSMDLYDMQKLKESAGLERAYIYNTILSQNRDEDKIKKILSLILEQKQFLQNFLSNTSLDSMILYNNTVSMKRQEIVKRYRELFFKKKLKKENAKEWFFVSTQRINEFHKLSLEIINNYLENVQKVHRGAKLALVFTLFLWIASLMGFFILIYILNRLINSETRLLHDLKVASYAFDAHEAMTITDPNGTIIRVNNAFTKITGYDAQEVIGKNPRVLKSHKHSEEFYKEMWRELHTTGYWSRDIYNKRKNGEIYMERLSITAIKDAKDITTHYIAQFLDISELKKAKEEALHQARHDFLTKLPNRGSMIEKLKGEIIRAKRQNFLDAFLFIDIDDFKSVNDNYGHHIGDRLLIAIAERLNNLIREEDYMARISGDEFCAILLDLDSDYKKASIFVKSICEKLLYHVSRPFFLDDYKISITISIGIKIFPNDDEDINAIINKSDTAMYKAKEAGKNRYFFFDKATEYRIKEINLLEKEMIIALEEEQFIFHFQPKVTTDRSKITGAEVLVRWKHPNRGVLMPAQFLFVATNMGIISDINLLALKSACCFIAENSIKDKIFSINISTKDLISNDFIDFVKETISSYDIEPSLIELEILEDELIDDFDTIINHMKNLKEFGIKFAIDDFGTGYSSIKYLQKLPIDTLKIDRYFIQNIETTSNKELIKMIAKIARTFGITLVVEGVETKEQLQFLADNNIKIFQGFYFSKAVDKEIFKKFL